MRTVIAALLAVVIGIIGLTLYLGPDDIRSCEAIPSGVSPCTAVDAIVAVSGGDTTARTDEAVRLYQNGWADTLIFSGAAADKSGPSNASAMRAHAITLGVSAGDILVEEASETTRQNAEQTQALLHNADVDSVIVVTSQYHQRRAGLEFSRYAGSDTQVLNHPVAVDNQWSPLWWLTPRGWYLAISESGKIVAFYLGGTR